MSRAHTFGQFGQFGQLGQLGQLGQFGQFAQFGQFDDAPEEEAWLHINLQTLREQMKDAESHLDSSHSDADCLKSPSVISNDRVQCKNEGPTDAKLIHKNEHLIEKKIKSITKSINKDESINMISENDAGSIFPNDVLCGRGKSVCNHPGNILFRDQVVAQLDNYENSRKSIQKHNICRQVFDQVKGMNPPGRFLKKSVRNGSSFWEELDTQKAMYKISQAFRDFRNSGRHLSHQPSESSEPSPDEVISSSNCVKIDP